jgi:hypothetical protein
MIPTTEERPLWKALKWVLDSELTYAMAGPAIRGDKNAQRLLRTPPKPLWKDRLEAKLKVIISDCVATVAPGDITLICNQAYTFATSSGQMKLVVGETEFTQMMSGPKPTTKDYKNTAAGGTYMYLLNNCFYGSARFTVYLKAMETAQAKFTKALDVCDALDTFVTTKSAEQQQLYLVCSQSILSVRAQVGNLTSMAVLGGYLNPLALHCTQLLNGVTGMVDLCTGDQYLERTRTLVFGFEDVAADESLINDRNWALFTMCQYTLPRDLGDVSGLIAQPIFDELVQLLNTKELLRNFGKLLAALGGPAFEALLELSPAQRTRFLNFWFDLEQEFVKKCPVGSDSTEILSYCNVALTAPNATQACFAVMGGNMPRINLPSSVTSLGWRVVNGIKIPAAFAKGNFGTDQACMKHTKSELGINPTQQKMTNYFAELVNACTQAAAAWNGGDMFPFTTVINGTKWRIIVGAQNKRTIVHIDSGYQNSPWVKK